MVLSLFGSASDVPRLSEVIQRRRFSPALFGCQASLTHQYHCAVAGGQCSCKLNEEEKKKHECQKRSWIGTGFYLCHPLPAEYFSQFAETRV